MRVPNGVRAVTINLIILAAVAFAVLLIQGCSQSAPAPTPAPTVTETVESTPYVTPAASPTGLGPLVYTVQEGDTLSDIARAHGVSLEDLIAANDLENPDVLRVGQTLIIPRGDSLDLPATVSPAALPRPTPLPTLTPSGPPVVEIDEVLGADDLLAETVIVRNDGGVVSLEEWTLSNAAGDTFVFPALTLFPDAQVRVRSAAGTDTPSDLYWGREKPAWSVGGFITLRDADGNVVDTYIVP